MTLYIVSAIAVFIISGLLVMVGLGAAFLFALLFYYLGLPLVPGCIALPARVIIDDFLLSRTAEMMTALRDILHDSLEIQLTTIQFD